MTDNKAETIEPEALNAVGRLLAIGAAHEIGITFIPDDDGWTVGYVRGNGGGYVVTEADLLTAATQAESPLIEVARRFERPNA